MQLPDRIRVFRAAALSILFAGEFDGGIEKRLSFGRGRTAGPAVLAAGISIAAA